MSDDLLIGARRLTIEDVLSVAVGGRKVGLSKDARRRVEKSRSVLEAFLDSGRIMYGVNTGFGRFAEVNISPQEIRSLQRNVVLSHAAGVGDPLSDEVVRAVLLLKANALAAGYSGVRPVVVETLLQMLNAGVHPVIPSKGSVGASGDLAPLSHMSLVLLGLGKARVGGKTMDGKRAMTQYNIPLLDLEAKEGLALMNGTQVMTAVGVFALDRARNLFGCGDVIGAMSVEALSGSAIPFDERIHSVRGQKGQMMVAANFRSLLEGSEILTERPVRRVQEGYSLRCIPQVHGAGRDVLGFVRSILEREVNGVTDIPLVFAQDGEVLSGGNFHGEPIGLAMDSLGVAVSSLAGISERRIACLMDSSTSGLPGFLVTEQGLHSGFMLAQITAAALVSENKGLAHPASVDSIPTSANQEDYVSMGMRAANKALQILENAENVLAVELLCSCQGVELRRPLKPALALQNVLSAFRQEVPHLDADRVLASDIEKANAFIRSGEWMRALPSHIQLG